MLLRSRLQANLGRVRHLQGAATLIANSASPNLAAESVGGGDDDSIGGDILRCAVVLLHATLEDFLRSAAREHWPVEDARALVEIPLIGTAGGRKPSFHLGDLAAHLSLSVRELVAESVSAHLDRTSYNNPGQIRNLMATLGVPESLLEPYAPSLAIMMSRRHWIAHQADLASAVEDAAGRPRPIDSKILGRWIVAVEQFGADFLSPPRAKTLTFRTGATDHDSS